MISFVIRQRLKIAGGVLVSIAFAVPSMGFAQQVGNPERQNQSQFVIGDEQQVVKNFLVEDLTCSRPTMLMIPDDGRIKRRAKRELRDIMLAYVTEMASYAGCVRREFAAAQASDVSEDAIMLIAEQYNSAVDELVAVADAYVERVGPMEELTNRRSLADPDIWPEPMSEWPGEPPNVSNF